MDKLYAIKIKQSDGTYGAAIPISVLAENVDWNSTLSLVDILGLVDTSASIQDQINNLKNTKATQASVNALDQKVDNAVEHITHNSEITNAREGVDGTEYSTLKERLDTEYNILLSQNTSSLVMVNEEPEDATKVNITTSDDEVELALQSDVDSAIAAVSAEATARQAAINEAISSEASARQTAISAEATARQAAINEAISSEASARQTAISAEATARQATDATLQNNINVEKARIDAITSLPSGSTSGDAELTDIRVGADGRSYTNAGTSVRSQISDIKNVFKINDILPMYYGGTGFVKSSDGSLNSVGGTYAYSAQIPVKPGEVYYYSGTGSASVLIVAAYTSTNTNAVVAKSIIGNGNVTSGIYIIPSGINYVRITSNPFTAGYFKKDDRTTEEVSNLKYNHGEDTGKLSSYTPSLTVRNGYIRVSDLKFVAASNYNTYGVIALAPKQILFVTSKTSDTISLLTECDKNGTPISNIVRGHATVVQCRRIMNTSTETKFYMVCSDPTYTFNISIVNSYLLGENDYFSCFYHSDGTIHEVNLIYSDPGTTNNYVMSTPIKLKSGETIIMRAQVSTSIGAFLKTDEYGSTYEALTMGSGSTILYSYTATEDMYVVCQYYMSTPHFISKLFDWNTNYSKNDIRKAVVSFSFDDSREDDYILHDLFAEKGLRCGFAMIASSDMDTSVNVPRYQQWKEEGFDVLSHSIDGSTCGNDVDVATVDTRMQLSKMRLNQRSFTASGWVTPSSSLGTNHIPTLKSYYDYGYSIYYGSYPSEYNGGRQPYQTFSDDPHELWRIHFGGTTLANLEAAVELAIENQGWVNIYWHAYEITEAHLQKLSDFLDYLNNKIANYKCRCLPPDKAFDYFYACRKTDIT